MQRIAAPVLLSVLLTFGPGCYGSRVTIGELCARRSVEDGGAPDGGGAVDVPPPRPRAPISGAFVTSRRPRFEWVGRGEAPGARVEICRDRACATIVASFDVASGSAGEPASDLPSGVLFWRLVGLRGPFVGYAPSVAWELRVPVRSAARATVHGRLVDVNGDGVADTAVGADRGTRSYVFHGSPAGLSPTPAAERVGPTRFALPTAGDFDGDGYTDLAVGAYAGGDTGEGVVLVFRGSPSGIEGSPTRTLLGFDGPEGFFGSALSGGADYNGDGYADLAVGAYGAAGGGRVHVYYGSPCGLSPQPGLSLTRSLTGDRFGIALGGVADVDGDGRHDLVVGAAGTSSSEGRVYVFAGTPGALSSTPMAVLSADVAGGDFGYALAVGDLDGDGVSDLVVGAPLEDVPAADAGAVYVFLGRPRGEPERVLHLSGLHGEGARTGISNALGDFDGDGLDDVAVGTFIGPGFVDVLVGREAGPVAVPALTVTGTAGETSHFGTALGAGDFDGDGHDDLLAGAQNVDAVAGRADVLSGSPSGLGTVPSVVLPGPAGPGARFGIVVLP